MIVPLPECQAGGISPTVRWFEPPRANVAMAAVPDAPLLELGLAIA